MIKKYDEMILESKIRLLLEGELFISKKFKDTLKKISKISGGSNDRHSDDTIDYFILNFVDSKEETDDLMNQNYLDIVEDKDDIVSFMSDKSFMKFDKVLKKDLFDLKGRSEIKIGRFVRSFLKISGGDYFTDKDIEEFVNLWKAVRSGKGENFEIVNGKDIMKYYSSESYLDKHNGNLGDSCMNDAEDQLGLYVDNPNVCKLLILKNPGDKVIGRALLWKPSKIESKTDGFDPQWIMDRIYTSKDSDMNKFKEYASNNGIAYRQYFTNTENRSRFAFKFKGDSYLSKIEIKLKKYEFSVYPYIDTFSFLENDKGILSNSGFNSIYQLFLTDVDGDAGPCDYCDNDDMENCDECYKLWDSINK
jgi:hypothetical protein